jgi:hypothetical protein
MDTKTLRTFADGGVIASNIIMQLGGFSRLQVMLGAYNFVDLKNGLSFKIKNPKANYIKITLNGKDLYDIEIGRIRGTTYKVVHSQEDVYAVDLRKVIEKHTGMYMAFEDGGDIVLEDAYNRDEYTDEETLIFSQSYKLANGGITAMEVLEAREFVGEKDWVKMKPKERLAATRYLIRTGKIGYYAYANGGTTKARPTHKSSYVKKYKVKYLIGYSDEEEGLKYYEEFYYADSKDVAALEVFDHLQRQGYTHIEILSITLMADKGMEVQSDEQLMEKYRKLKGNYVPDWFRDMPTRYKVEIIEEIEEGYEDEKPEGDEFARGGSIESKRERVIDYYINNEDDETLNDFGVPERALENRDKYYKEIFEKISDQFEDEEIYYKFRELNIDEASEEPEDYAHGGKVKEKIFIEYLNKKKGYVMDRKYFNSYEEAERWARDNFDKFDKDYIKYEYEAMAKGGKVKDPHPDYPDFVSMQYADGGYDTDDKVNVYVLLKPSQYYYDSDNTTNKKYWFKLNGNPVSREVAKEMADKYLQKYNLPLSDRKIGYVRRYGRYEDGGDIEFGEDLGNGFSVGNDVYITDSKSMYKGKTGFVSGLAGKDLLVTISENGNERSIVVSKKGVEMIDAPMADGGEIGNKEISKEDVKKLYDRYKYLENLDEQRGGNTGFKNQYKNVINEIENKYVKKIIENSKYEDLKNMYDKKLNFTRFSTKKLGLSLTTFSKYWMNSGGWKIERLSDEEKDKVIKELKKLFPGIIIEKPVFNTTEYSYGVEKYEYIYMVINFDKYAKGGQMDKKPAKFKDKVKAISKSLEGKKVPKRVRKDYGATYDKKESVDAAKRIAGSMAKKERKRYEI